MINLSPDAGQRTEATRSEPDGTVPQVKLACLRCQRRKIRCDGQLPSCSNCRNASAVCEDGISARLRALPRAEIKNLRSRIAWLESVIRERCPDVDLSQNGNGGPRNAPAQQPDDDEDAAATQPRAGREPSASFNDPPEAANASQQSSQQVIPLGTGGGPNASAHEIGLVSLGASQEPRYIGPSSGYFLARVMLSRRHGASAEDLPMPMQQRTDASVVHELVEAMQGPLPLPSRTLAERICSSYFELIHPQYPVLHQPSFMKMLESMYAADGTSPPPPPVVSFQVYMVLAIGASALATRMNIRLPSDSYCMSALTFFHLLNLEGSLQGLQCLLLLQIFAIHSPATRFNVWYLNYHCLAAAVDHGIQRNVTTTAAAISLLDQEMRTRVFWVVIMLDRIIATMMGRPIGLRDEACDLRLPQGIPDSLLAAAGQCVTLEETPPLDMSIHLFRAAKINSEIKYVANSIVQEAPRYAYPPVADIHGWQKNVLQQLDDWAAGIPASSSSSSSSDRPAAASYMELVCRLRYHNLCMLLLRPSPAIPRPTPEALDRCYQSAHKSIEILDEMYRNNLLIHSWMTFHSLVFSVLTMLYCLREEPAISESHPLDHVTATLSAALSVLSATGEHWSGAKKCRHTLENLGKSTLQTLRERHERRQHNDTGAGAGASNRRTSSRLQSQRLLDISVDGNYSQPAAAIHDPMLPIYGGDPNLGDSFDEYFPNVDSINVDVMLQDLFQEFIPMYGAST